MKSFALILWLILGNGKQQILTTTHADDAASCRATAQALVEKHAARGQQVRYLCHEVVPEDTDVDVNGNPLPPEKVVH